MMNKKLSYKLVMTIGLTLFAIFFGAGNFIFPPLLGHQAGTNVIPAVIGFLLGAVTLPLLGIIATTLFGGDTSKLMNRVHPLFGLIFTIILYLAIGPLFAVPRTAAVSYSMVLGPLLGNNWYILVIFTFIYFVATYYFCLNPAKLVDIIGKYMTPILLFLIATIVAVALMNPVGTAIEPIETYRYNALFMGLTEGFQTMDAMAAFITVGIVIGAINQFGITDKKEMTKYATVGGIVAAIGLSVIYVSLALVGASSGTFVQGSDGAAILTAIVQELFGPFGMVLLGLTITLACLSTAIALTSACGTHFRQLVPAISHRKWLLIFCGFSFAVSNLGLTTLLSITLPILKIIYPVVIVLIAYAFIDKYIYDKPLFYVNGVIVTLIFSTIAEIHALGFTGNMLSSVELLPMYSTGFAWIFPWLLVSIVMSFIPSKQGEPTKGIKAS